MIPKVHLPCSDCGSSDALTDYGTHTHCFSCGIHKVLVKENNNISNNNYNNSLIITNNNKINNMIQIEPNNSWRGISKDTFKFYDCKFQVDNTGKFTQVDFHYPNGSCKHRLVDTKTFYTTGPMTDSDLYGYNKFSPGSSKAITITEGEIDCLSAFQMLGSKYPAITFKASACAGKDCAKQFKYIDSFDRIYLCLDNDDVGRRTAQAIASLFDPNKIYVCQFAEGMKDANDYLTQGKSEEFVKLWWGSKRYLPKGIINGYEEIREVLGRTTASSLASYPFPTLNEMTYGIREGEVNLFTAMEKVGKTEIMRAIEHHLLKTTDYNIGIIHLEEDEKRSVQGLLSYELDTPVHLPDSCVSIDDQLSAYKSLVKREGRLNFYTHFGSDDPDTILGVLRYMVSSLGCKFIFLDHITMLVTGYEGDDERRKLDYISTRLAMLTRELKFTLFLVSHVNDDGKTRGSRNISKVADLIVHLDRNPEADSIDGRNTTSVLVKGNRFAARSGPAGYLWFDPSKYQVKEKEVDDVLLSDVIDNPF